MLPKNGTISMDDIRKELNKSGSINLNDSDVRKLANKPSGSISLKDFYGKSNIEVILDRYISYLRDQDDYYIFREEDVSGYEVIDKYDFSVLVVNRIRFDAEMNFREGIKELLGKNIYVSFILNDVKTPEFIFKVVEVDYTYHMTTTSKELTDIFNDYVNSLDDTPFIIKAYIK
ncbi:hypothetical protein KST74_08555 [Fusobacterium nucleatum]|uniref:hypothetical protein n=1 Tax=Fusobacterium nucleatum TaxID=851 RepID=UPI0030D2D642